MGDRRQRVLRVGVRSPLDAHVEPGGRDLGVASHLRPGGIACQWLPIYELTPKDVKTVLRTFGESFSHVMIWLTHYDAEIVGSNAPIVLDEDALARRIAFPAIASDLEAVDMATAEDFLSYFVAATGGSREFAAGGGVNTDDNLTLEFSAAESIGVAHVMGDNVPALAGVRESILDVLTPAPAGAARTEQVARWQRNDDAARLYDQAHALFLWGESGGAAFRRSREGLLASFPRYAPFRFLEREYQAGVAETPRRIAYADFAVSTSRRGGEVQRADGLVVVGREEVHGAGQLQGQRLHLVYCHRRRVFRGPLYGWRTHHRRCRYCHGTGQCHRRCHTFTDITQSVHRSPFC